MRNSFLFTILLLLSSTTLSCTAQEKLSKHTYALSEGEKSPSATIDQLAWLSGEWIGEGLGGHAEEFWSAPKGGHITGAFRLFEDNQLIFSEHMDLAERDGSVSLRLKHFNPDMTGWEEKDKYVEFPLVRITNDEINFRGLTYKKINEDKLEIYLVINYEDGPKEEKFTFFRSR